MKKYSYVSLLTNDSYVYGIILLSASLHKVDSQYPLHVLITENVSVPVREILSQLNITYELVEEIKLPEKISQHNYKIKPALAFTWENCWTKLKIFTLTQFDKIVFLDADILVLKNLDHLFQRPHLTAALDGEYFNLWPDQDHFNSGCLVIEPNVEEYNNILNYGLSFTEDVLPNCVFADQELLNFYYKDWPQKRELHLSKYYNIFPPYTVDTDIPDLQENAYFVHYVGRKPWVNWTRDSTDKYSEYFYQLGQSYINNEIKYLNTTKIRSKLILTVYAICKNEKSNVEKWLQCFTKADYVCILDTGSTDGTWELLQQKKKQYSNLILDQKIISPWRFDTARNESLKLVPKETNIYFMVDLDEIIKQSDWVDLIKEYWTPNFSRCAYQYHRDIDENDNIIRTFQEYRIHSNYWNHYENIVHEALYNKIGEKYFYTNDCVMIPIEVYHYPKKNKITNYAELCEEQLKIDPNNHVMRLQAAIEHEILQNYKKAKEHYFTLIHNDENTLQSFEMARCFVGLSLIAIENNQLEAGLFYLLESRLSCPFFSDGYLIATQTYYNLHQFQQAYEVIKAGIQNCQESFWCSITDVNNDTTYYLLGLICQELQKEEEALAAFTVANKINPNQEYQQKIDYELQLYINKIKKVDYN